MLRRFAQAVHETVETKLAGTETPVRVFGLVAHAPAQFSWALDGRERSASFGYGLVPGAYDKDTDGVEFTCSLVRPGQPPEALFRTFLSPHEIPAHRGHRVARVALPDHPAGSRLEVTTGPGPHGNNAYDWAYVSDFALADTGTAPAGGR